MICHTRKNHFLYGNLSFRPEMTSYPKNVTLSKEIPYFDRSQRHTNKVQLLLKNPGFFLPEATLQRIFIIYHWNEFRLRRLTEKHELRYIVKCNDEDTVQRPQKLRVSDSWRRDRGSGTEAPFFPSPEKIFFSLRAHICPADNLSSRRTLQTCVGKACRLRRAVARVLNLFS